MSIANGALCLYPPQESRGMRLPIDFFLNSLADDRGDLGVGIILSGMGADGSQGLKAIKGKNGIAMVQDPTTAKFDSMPRHAMDAVKIDIVAPCHELPEKLLALLHHIPDIKTNSDLEVKDKSELEKINTLLRIYTGNDFSSYKKSTMYRRIERRIIVRKLDNISSYVKFLQENPVEIGILFKESLIGVTSFFRDVKVWEELKDTVFPEVINGLKNGYALRAWIPGCATGEEAYSLAITFKEALNKCAPRKNISLQIFASDLDNDSIELARKGLFKEAIESHVPQDLLLRYFDKTDDGYCISTEIREMVIFAEHNLIMHPPFINIDIISCRNLLIYLDSELQKKILNMFFNSLRGQGLLILGNSETVGSLNHLFQTVNLRLKIFRRSGEESKPGLPNFPSSFSQTKNTYPETNQAEAPAQNIQAFAEKILLQQFTPPSVLVNGDGDILHISGLVSKYLASSAGKTNMNIFAMLREGLQKEFPSAFVKAIRNKKSVVLPNIILNTNGNTNYVTVHIQYIDKPAQLRGNAMIIFSDVSHKSGLNNGGNTKNDTSSTPMEAELEKELMYAREEMQSTLENMQTTQEELKSTNEQLQSANEELQSTNEELTSSKEEMQSLNEELQTLNAELQVKIDDFLRVDNDMKNLLNSTDVATLFLDKELKIRRYTNQATKIFKLIKSDIGRPFTDQVSDLLYPEMADDAIDVLETLVYKQKQIPAKNGFWFSIRIMPYRTSDDRIDGLVITFINITELKQAEEKLKILDNEK